MRCETLADVLAEMADQDLYEVLGVSFDASLDVIKRAYRQLALACHPDRHPEDPTCEERFKQAAAAFEVLSNSNARAEYDMSRSFEPGFPGTLKSEHLRRAARRWGIPVEIHYTQGDFDFSAAPNVGPYTAVSYNQTTRKRVGRRYRRFRIIVYGAYNAFGLIGSEENGVAILDEDYRRVLTDRILPQHSGYFGPSTEQLGLAEWLVNMSTSEFRSFVNAFPRSRYILDARLEPAQER